MGKVIYCTHVIKEVPLKNIYIYGLNEISWDFFSEEWNNKKILNGCSSVLV